MLHYSLILSRVRQHPDYDYEIVEASVKRAEIVWTRHGKEVGRSVFDLEQAKRQGTGAPGTNDPGMLAKYPDTMLLARAVSNGVKRYAPDVLNGMPVYTPGEIEEESAVYSAPSKGTKGDAMRAEMQVRAEASIDTTAVDVAAGPYTGPTADEGEGSLEL